MGETGKNGCSQVLLKRHPLFQRARDALSSSFQSTLPVREELSGHGEFERMPNRWGKFPAPSDPSGKFPRAL